MKVQDIKPDIPQEYVENVELFEEKFLEVVRNGEWYQDAPTIAAARLFLAFLKMEDTLDDSLNTLDMYRNLIADELTEWYNQLPPTLEEMVEEAREHNKLLKSWQN